MIGGVTVATAVGHGMMWGPGVARIGADLAVTGATDVTDVAGWSMDRFDEQGRSPSYDPIALPFPVSAGDSSAQTTVARNEYGRFWSSGTPPKHAYAVCPE